MDSKMERDATFIGIFGFVLTLLGGIAYFFMGEWWQMLGCVVGVLLMLFVLWVFEN